jgi:ABC-type Zn uptake system ZnuABC Zn-binding protein ZnuA
MAGVDLVLCDGVGRTETWARQEMDRIRDTGTVVSVDRAPGTNEVPANGLLYLDPVLAARYARLVGDAMARRVPSQGDAFRSRAAAYVAEIDGIAASFQPRPGAQVMVLSGLFAPMLARLGVGSVLVDADYLNLTAGDAQTVRRAAEAAGVTSLLVPFDTPPGTLTYLAEQTGLKPFTIDPLGYPNYPQHGSYLDVLRFNLEQLTLATAG